MALLFIINCLLLAGGGCARGSLAREHRYVLAVPSRDASAQPPGAPTLRVGPIRGEGLARGTLLWTRISPIEVEPWKNHQWALPAPEIVTEAVIGWARASGRFREAGAGETSGPGKIWILRGTLEALEQEESLEGWAGRVRLRLILEEVAAGKPRLLWQGVLDRGAPAEVRHPAAVVHALGRALATGLDEAAGAWPFPSGESRDSPGGSGKARASHPVQGPLPLPRGPDREGNS